MSHRKFWVFPVIVVIKPIAPNHGKFTIMGSIKSWWGGGSKRKDPKILPVRYEILQFERALQNFWEF